MLNKVIEIVRQAGKLMYARDFEVQNKGAVTNNVTTTDLAVQAFLESKLTALIEGSYFLGEENYEIAMDKKYQWIVDPIDGTANFIRNLDASVISVALVKDGRAVLGVIYNPYRDECVYAEEGKGAYMNGEPIRVSDRPLESSVFCTAYSLYNKDLAKHCMNILNDIYYKCEDFRRFGAAALELAYLACARVELFFEIRLFPWDYAAAVVIVKEAGGYIGTIEYDDIVYNRPIPIIAANTKENFDYLSELIKGEIPQIPYKE